jgi:hypothetical protein
LLLSVEACPQCEETRCISATLFRLPHFRIGITQQMLQQITLGGAMIALPIFLQIRLEYSALRAGGSVEGI